MISLEQARFEWTARQGLGQVGSSLGLVGGWIRSLGGVEPYIALWARDNSTTKAAVDEQLASGELWIAPGVRGCIWLMRADDVPFALKVAHSEYEKRTVRELAKLNVDWNELDAVEVAALDLLQGGPLSIDEMRQELGPDVVRSLGDAGKRYGHSTTLPAALRLLEGEGRVRRWPTGNTVDTSRYLWEAHDYGEAFDAVPDDPDSLAIGLARRFFDWASPATKTEFMGWSSLGKRASEAAIAALGDDLKTVDSDWAGELLYSMSGSRRGRSKTRAAADRSVYLLPSQDNLVSLRGGAAVLADPRHHGRTILSMMGREAELGTSRWMWQHPMIYRGEWIGFWEWDEEEGEVVFAGFDPLEDEVLAAAQETSGALAGFIRNEFGGIARANSVDGLKARRAPRRGHQSNGWRPERFLSPDGRYAASLVKDRDDRRVIGRLLALALVTVDI